MPTLRFTFEVRGLTMKTKPSFFGNMNFDRSVFEEQPSTTDSPCQPQRKRPTSSFNFIRERELEQWEKDEFKKQTLDPAYACFAQNINHDLD
jgi:hypothetical protein